MKRITTYITCLIISLFVGCNKDGQSSSTPSLGFNGIEGAATVELLNDKDLIVESSVKVTRADFDKVYPKDWSINVPTNYYRKGAFVASKIFYD